MNPIIFRILLNRIVGQVNKLVIQIVDIVHLTTGSNIALFKPVSFQNAVNWSN